MPIHKIIMPAIENGKYIGLLAILYYYEYAYFVIHKVRLRFFTYGSGHYL